MYGTIFRMKVKPGQQGRVNELFEEWDQERQPKIEGAVGGVFMRPDRSPNELIGVAIFRDKASYIANADDPEQHAWFMKLREALEADPEWEDGEYVWASGIAP